MSGAATNETIRTRIWLEEPEPDNPFATRAAYCHGYDVYGEMLGRARWVDMLFLLFRGEAPTPAQAALLESLAVVLMNPGPRDPAVHAAMCAGVGGSTAAASLMAALAVGAGQYKGAREVFLAMNLWAACGEDIALWKQRLSTISTQVSSIWPEMEHPPGFDPHGASTSASVKKILACLANLSPGSLLRWLANHREGLEAVAGTPLALTAVASAAYMDLGLTSQEGEMFHLFLRMPGVAAHALEQQRLGHKNFPFFALELEDDPLQETP